MIIPADASPTCEGYKGVADHGEHVITDYVFGAVVNGNELESWPPISIGEVVGGQQGLPFPGPRPGLPLRGRGAAWGIVLHPQASSGGR